MLMGMSAWGGTGFGDSNTISVDTRPATITTQPVNQTARLGGNVTFRVSASCPTTTICQWRKNGSVIAGATNAALSFSSVGASDVAIYDVLITWPWGTLTSQTASLNLLEVALEPDSALWVSGADLVLRCEGVGWPSLSYKWYSNNIPISGADKPTLAFDSLLPSMAAGYRCMISNGFASVQSREVLVRLPGQVISGGPTRPANAPVVTFDGLDPVSGRILRGERTWVAMATSYSGGTVFYTTDGSEPVPGANGIEYAGPFFLVDSCTVKAVAWDALFANSATAPPITLEIRPLYPAMAACQGGGSAILDTPSYSGNLFVSNTLLQATATPGSGWSFLRWNGATNAITKASVRVVSAKTVEAVFGTPYTTISGGVGSGSVTRSPDLAVYPYGSNLKLLAQPQSGNYLFRWQPGGQTTNPLAVTVTSPYLTNSAVFSPMLAGYVSLVVDPLGNGRTSVSPAQGQYQQGSIVTLTATPNYQHLFAGWTGDLASTNNPQSVTLNSSKSIKALFIPDLRVIMQPVSKNVVAGGVLNLAVGATGPPPLSYQWRHNGSSIPGASNFLYSTMSPTLADAGDYDVLISTGGITVTSRLACVTVSPPGSIVGWGNQPAGASGALAKNVSVAAGAAHALSVGANGAVLGWGNNSDGQTSIPYGLSNVVAITAGLDHSVALRADGKLLAWGRNNYGQINLPLGLQSCVALSAGIQYTLALNASGTVAAWGRGDVGQTNVPIGLSNVVSVAAGDTFGLALQADGKVVAWGNNSYGLTNIPGSMSNVVAIDAGASHALALLNTGTVIAWGNNSEGQTNIPPGLSNVVCIAAGTSHSLALRDNGTIVAWGRNNSGQLTYPAGLGGVAAVSAASDYCLALKSAPPVVLALKRYGTSVVLSWPAAAGGYFLTSTKSLSQPVWLPVGWPVGVTETLRSVQVLNTNSQQFFRLESKQ